MENNDKSSEGQIKLKQQVEYYLSDENLRSDKFFHDKISADTEVNFTNLQHRAIWI
jgi:hypothetical protein